MGSSNNINILKDDDTAIKWLEEFIYKSEYRNFKSSAQILLEYANKCLEDLKKIENLGEEIISENDIKDVKKYLENINFADKCRQKTICDSEFVLGTVSDEDFNRITTLSEEEIKRISTSENESDKKLRGEIRKVLRFYNMQLKYAHTAKIVFFANETMDSVKVNNSSLKEIVITSALMHDVGRFYQALNYDDFTDRKMTNDSKAKEYNIDQRLLDGVQSDKVGHGVLGYYYSIMNLFRMNYFEIIDDKHLITEIVSAFVVRFHGMSNDDLKLFDINLTEQELPKLELNTFENIIDEAYQKAPFLEVKEKYKIHIKDFLYNILKKEINEQLDDLAETMSIRKEEIIETMVDKIMVSLENENSCKTSFLQRFFKFLSVYKKTEENGDKELEQLASEVLNEITKVKEETYGYYKYENAIAEVSTEEIMYGLKSMADYDVAIGIYKMFKANDNIQHYKAIFSLPLSITTDSDKLDILNQRANKAYRTIYEPNYYRISLNDNMSIPDLFDELGIKDIKLKNEIYKLNGVDVGDENIVRLLNEEKMKIPIEIAYDYFEKHIKNDNDEKAKLNVILMPEDIKNFYKYNGMSENKIGFSSIRSLLWTINQFLFTNMRMKSSFEILKKYNFIEKIYYTYPENVRKIIKPFMTYTLYYIDKTIEKDTLLYTAESMKEHTSDVSAMYQELSENEIKKYENILDNFEMTPKEEQVEWGG